jgi:hypothetical protein
MVIKYKMKLFMFKLGMVVDLITYLYFKKYYNLVIQNFKYLET